MKSKDQGFVSELLICFLAILNMLALIYATIYYAGFVVDERDYESSLARYDGDPITHDGKYLGVDCSLVVIGNASSVSCDWERALPIKMGDPVIQKIQSEKLGLIAISRIFPTSRNNSQCLVFKAKTFTTKECSELD